MRPYEDIMGERSAQPKAVLVPLLFGRFLEGREMFPLGVLVCQGEQAMGVLWRRSVETSWGSRSRLRLSEMLPFPLLTLAG